LGWRLGDMDEKPPYRCERRAAAGWIAAKVAPVYVHKRDVAEFVLGENVD